MKNLRGIFVFIILTTVFACENEVDLSTEPEDVTVVYGLLDYSADTQFVKINRGFLEEGTNAVTLAQNPNNLYYDSLEVELVNLYTDEVFPLKTITRPKESGVFSSDSNVVFYIDTNIFIENLYQLNVRQPDGKLTTAQTEVLENVILEDPVINEFRQNLIALANNNGIVDEQLEFSHSEKVARFQVIAYFNYIEELDGVEYPRAVEIPIGTVINQRQVERNDVELTFSAENFYRTIAARVPETSSRKIIPFDRRAITLEIIAADEDYNFYRDLNGPIDGIAQVRPDFTNVENGIGLFASRSIARYNTGLTAETRQQLRSGQYTGNHNFVDP